MHPVDLIEDAAIAYGYDNLTSELVPAFTVGDPQPVEERSADARQILVGLGFPPGDDAGPVQRAGGVRANGASSRPTIAC